jgi:serine phosphatase RsbU (regulator of sigma subunit)
VTPHDDEDDGSERTIFISARRSADTPVVRDAIGHYLVAIAGADPGRRVEIGAEPITIGRDAKQTLSFADSEMSRRHARVALVNGDVIAEDLGSTNGTFVDDERLTAPVKLKEGSIVRFGGQFFKYERRSKSDVQRSQELDRDLQKASRYVVSLLPAPITSGAVHAEWRFVPSAQLGGDAFGYYWLNATTFVFYLIDVSGHGVGSAMHSVTVLNVLRQRALPNVSFENPAEVLASLNSRFQMDTHSGLFFTMWYGVYRTTDRTLTYSSAGHHPAYLVPFDRRESLPLGQPALTIGMLPDVEYDTLQTTVPPGSSLHVFSDGVFEIVTSDQKRWALSDFLPLLTRPAEPGVAESERVYRAVRQAAGPGVLDDDFSLLVVTFP